MTVKKLKEILEKLPEDFVVKVYASDEIEFSMFETLKNKYEINHKEKEITFEMVWED